MLLSTLSSPRSNLNSCNDFKHVLYARYWTTVKKTEQEIVNKMNIHRTQCNRVKLASLITRQTQRTSLWAVPKGNCARSSLGSLIHHAIMFLSTSLKLLTSSGQQAICDHNYFTKEAAKQKQGHLGC